MFLRRRHHFVLLCGDDGALLAGGNASALFAARDDNAARKKILARLADHPKAAVTLLFNGSRQEFRFETLPPLGLFDRRKLLHRRLRQAFPKAYAAAASLKDGHALLAGVQPNPALSAWADSLPNSFATLGLLPTEAAALLLRLAPEARHGWAMLLARFRSGGVRQIVTCDGVLVFTRIIAAFPDGARAMIEDSRGYLARFGLTPGTEMRIVALMKNAGKVAGMTSMTPQQAAMACGLDIGDHDDEDTDALFAAFVLSQRRLSLALTSGALQTRKRQATIALAGWRAALAVMIVAVLSTGWSCAGLVAQLYDNHRDAKALDDLRRRMAAEQVTLAPAGQPLDRLRAALERQRLFSDSQNEPWDLTKRLTASLDGKAYAAGFEWRDGGELRLTLRLAGDRTGAQDRESIVRDFRNLAVQAGRDLPGYDVVITRYPFPAMSQDILTNAATAATPAPDRPEAEMTIRKRS